MTHHIDDTNKMITAVEWLFLMLNNPNRDQEFANKILEGAKAMEKEQNILIYRRGYIDGVGETQLTNSVIKNK